MHLLVDFFVAREWSLLAADHNDGSRNPEGVFTVTCETCHEFE
jgi:hypothetical protein